MAHFLLFTIVILTPTEKQILRAAQDDNHWRKAKGLPPSRWRLRPPFVPNPEFVEELKPILGPDPVEGPKGMNRLPAL